MARPSVDAGDGLIWILAGALAGLTIGGGLMYLGLLAADWLLDN